MDTNKKLSSYKCVVTMVSQKEADRYLYRGVSDAMHNKNGGRLVPKVTGQSTYTFHISTVEAAPLDGSWPLGESVKGAIRRHELRREGYSTSYISTTPHFSRAMIYARGRDLNNSGVVYVIDRELLAAAGVTEHVVADTVPNPSVPEDAEVLLIAADCGVLLAHVVAETVLLPLHKG